MNDVTDAALGLIGLSPSFLPPPSPTVPTKRKQTHERAPATPVFVAPLEQGEYEGIDCICGFSYDDGFSIQCDKCERWVHGVCYGIVNAEEVDGCSWMCLSCEPRVVDVERARKIQVERKKSMDARRSSAPGSSTNHRGRGGGGGGAGKTRRPSAVAHVEGHGKKKRRPSIINASTSVSSQLDDEHIDVGDAWTQSYVPITHDVISSQETREKLQRHAQNWRGVTALASPQPESLTTVKPVAVPASPYANPAVRPPSFGLHTTAPISSESLITPYTSNITPSATYLSDPLNAYAQMGVPKPFVHLIGQPLDVALDSRWQGDTSRFARSGCRPNAVLRPMVCSRSPDSQDKDDILSFGVFALRDLKANEEVVLGWEWDDGSAIHHLPAAIQSQHLFKYDHDSPDELNFLRKQLSVVLHTLSSTFTTCACGSKARDCAIALASTFIDADLSQPPPTSSPGAGPSTLPPIDLGPLVGTQRGFRTREKLPHSGGIGGVEMCDDPAPSNWKGKGKARAMDSPIDMDSPVVVDDDDDEEMGRRVQGYGHKHRRFSTNDSPHLNRTTKRLPRKRNLANLLRPPDISPPPMLPPRPPEDEDTDDGRMDVDADADAQMDKEVEAKMPPKMRKRWIHSSADTLKKIRAESGWEEEGIGLGLSMASTSSSSSITTPFSGQSTSGAHVVIGDDATHPPRPMPPPPMPASLDPTTVTSITPPPPPPPPSSTSSLPSLSPRPSPRPTLGTFDLLPAFTGAAGPSKGLAFNPTTSPTTSFSKLSLLSPVVLHGSPPLGGRGSGTVNPTSSTTTTASSSSSSSSSSSTAAAPSSSLAPASPYAIPGLLSTREEDVRVSDMSVVEREEPRHDQPTLLDVPSSPRVRFVSPPSVDLPASFQRRSSPLRTVVTTSSMPETPPPLESDEVVKEPADEDVAMESVAAEPPATEALVSAPARAGHVPSTPPSIELSPPPLIPPPLAPATVMPDVAMDTDITVVDQPSSLLEPPPSPPPPHPSSTSPSVPPAPSSAPNPTAALDAEPQPEPTPVEEPTPRRTPTPPPPPPPQKVKLSLKDFAMRRKKQREEEAKNSPVITESAPLPVESVGEKEERKEGGAGVDATAAAGKEVGKMDVEVEVKVKVKVQSEREKEQQVDVPRTRSDPGSRRLSEATTHSDSNETDRTPPSSTPPLTPCTPPRDCTHTPPPLSPSRSRSATPPQAQSQLHVHEKENEQPMSLQAKIEAVEHVLPAEYSRPFGSSNCGAASPVPPPPPSSLLGTPTVIPVYTDAYRGHHRRPSSQEDGEITSSRSEASSPPPLPPPSASSQPSRPPSQPPPSSIPPAAPKAYSNGTNGGYTPRVNTPPLGPRFHAGAGYSPPGGRWQSNAPAASSSTSSSHATTSMTGAKRPPSAPRASRGYAQSYTPSYPPPPRSGSSHGQQYLPRGPSADRDRMDWDRDRSWSRPRGRGSGGNWGR
ncbi:hypothetical protein ONZ45_g10843 [Pleurotus djamor]|nr:hypothetical protein ONZ45_g10843 [Pleurotus djamor]